MKKLLLSVICFLSIFSCEKYDAKKELIIKKKVIESYKLTDNGRYPKLIKAYFTIDNEIPDRDFMMVGVSIYSTNKFLIKDLKEIVDKSDNDSVTKEAQRLLDSVSLAQEYFLQFRNIDYTQFDK